VTSSELLK